MTDIPFAQIPEFGEKEKKFNKVNFLKILPGYPVRIRILTPAPVPMVVKHFLPKQRISVVCLGEECPICLNNRKLADANPGVPYNEIQGIIGRQTRFLINVLNRTPVKKTEKETYYAGIDGKFPAVSSFGEDLTSIKAVPLNTVEVLEKGPTLFQQFNAINDSYRDSEENRVGINNFDIVLSASGKGKNMIINALPAMQYSDKIDIDTDSLYNLEKVSIRLSKEEMWKLLEGISFQDVVEARKAVSVTSMEDDATTKLAKAVEDSLDKFFEDES